MKNYAIIIPVLDPDEKTTIFADKLIEAGFKDIIVVDDGSCKETQKYFDEIRNHSECTVLVHEENKGKGAALKTAFAFLAVQRPDIDAAITADGDGQHNVASIKKCIAQFEEHPDSVIFGGRDFKSGNVPLRSRMGNGISTVVYKFACGLKIKDTQTGLRIIPAGYFEKFSTLKGDRYDYETSMIIEIADEKIPYLEVSIETIYLDDNKSTHFNTVKDAVKIYRIVLKRMIKFLINSLICWVIDEGLYYLFLTVLVGVFEYETRTIMSIIFARVLSSIVNFALNRKTVFKTNLSVWRSALRYYALAACMLFVSTCLVDLIAVKMLGVDGFASVVVKIVVDIILFIASYTVQRKWVFKNK